MSVYCQNCDHLRAENKLLQAELDEANERIKKMSKGDLGPESILSGYSVLVKSLEKRRNELRSELHTALAENEDLCNNIDAARQDMADMRAGALEGKLWAENERLRDAECGAMWTFSEGGLKDNGAVFCLKCGRLIKEVRPDKESDDEED